MRRRLFAAALLVPAIMGLSACRGYGMAEKTSKDVQKYYKALSSVSSEYNITSDYNGRVNKFTLSYIVSKDKATTVTVVSPEEIKGISATIDKSTLELSFGGTSLALEMPGIKGFSPLEALPSLLSDLGNRIPTEISSEKISGIDCAALTYEFTDGRQSVAKRVWFDVNTLHPVKAELYLDGMSVFSIEFLKFGAA